MSVSEPLSFWPVHFVVPSFTPVGFPTVSCSSRGSAVIDLQMIEAPPQKDARLFHLEVREGQRDGLPRGHLHHPQALTVAGVVQGPVLGRDDPRPLSGKTPTALDR